MIGSKSKGAAFKTPKKKKILKQQPKQKSAFKLKTTKKPLPKPKPKTKTCSQHQPPIPYRLRVKFQFSDARSVAATSKPKSQLQSCLRSTLRQILLKKQNSSRSGGASLGPNSPSCHQSWRQDPGHGD
ncbi:hypothetical protein Q8A73_015569 [Channa argus]|nr:hypothetical protein Q8A73_015569 [Channa argus]